MMKYASRFAIVAVITTLLGAGQASACLFPFWGGYGSGYGYGGGYAYAPPAWSYSPGWAAGYSGYYSAAYAPSGCCCPVPCCDPCGGGCSGGGCSAGCSAVTGTSGSLKPVDDPEFPTGRTLPSTDGRGAGSDRGSSDYDALQAKPDDFDANDALFPSDPPAGGGLPPVGGATGTGAAGDSDFPGLDFPGGTHSSRRLPIAEPNAGGTDVPDTDTTEPAGGATTPEAGAGGVPAGDDFDSPAEGPAGSTMRLRPNRAAMQLITRHRDVISPVRLAGLSAATPETRVAVASKSSVTTVSSSHRKTDSVRWISLPAAVGHERL